MLVAAAVAKGFALPFMWRQWEVSPDPGTTKCCVLHIITGSSLFSYFKSRVIKSDKPFEGVLGVLLTALKL